MNISKPLIIILYIGMAACKVSSTQPTVDPPVDATPDNIREASFRYLFAYKSPARDPNVKLFFIAFSEAIVPIPSSFGDSDPSDQFLSRFTFNAPPVRKFSKCNIALEGVFDKLTNERGALFRVGPITMLDSVHAEAQAGYFVGGLGGSGDILQLQKTDSAWVVIKDLVRWIS
jgi:hypothetical protein